MIYAAILFFCTSVILFLCIFLILIGHPLVSLGLFILYGCVNLALYKWMPRF